MGAARRGGPPTASSIAQISLRMRTEKAKFKEKYGYDLAPPKTYEELRDIAEFFTRPPKPSTASRPGTAKSTMEITMGFQQVMWSFGGSYGDPETYKVEGHLNSDDVVAALEYYTSLRVFSPPDAPNYYWAETLDAFKAGKVAMAMDYFAFFPGVVDSNQNPNYYDKNRLLCLTCRSQGTRHQHRRSRHVNLCLLQKPRHRQAVSDNGLCRNRYRKNGHSWVGFTPHEEVLQSEVFLNATPFNRAFAASFPYLQDFWAVPEYAELLEACQTGVEPSYHRIQICQRSAG